MLEPTLAELYLAFRQAKAALYYERRGVGLLDLAAYEDDLPANLAALKTKLTQDQWFDGIDPGQVWVIPKRLVAPTDEDDDVVHIGGRAASVEAPRLDIQLRLSPSPEFAIVELLYLRRFGPAMDSILSKDVLGYRLDLREGQLDPTRRWVFEYWPTRYQQFRTLPLDAARKALKTSAEPVLIISADLASFYDTVAPSFLLDDGFVALMNATEPGAAVDVEEYREATSSLLQAYGRFRAEGTLRAGVPMNVGVPIGALTSRVIANVALATLDTQISALPNVLCYRRYVDDLVIVARASDSVAFDDVLQQFLPLASTMDSLLHLNVEVLDRLGSEFQVQKTKVRVHSLTGVPGQDFVDAVAADFDRVVSERRAFLDTSTLLRDGASHLVRAGQEEGSPLRVLRDADRARLERYSLSTSLQSLERVSSLVDRDQARAAVRRTLERVGRVLDADDNWVSNLDVTLRLLKLAISAEDWQSCSELNARMDQTWGTVEALKASVASLHHRDRPIDPDRTRPWIWLRNYLHGRRLEAVCSAIPTDFIVSELRQWLPNGLLMGTGQLGAVALRRRAEALVASDLRARDREEDQASSADDGVADPLWMRAELSDDNNLSIRLDRIQEFVGLCEELGEQPWLLSSARLFLCTRPPSYFDIARRWFYRTESSGFSETVFTDLLEVVNAVRGTRYRDPVGTRLGPHTVSIAGSSRNLLLGGEPLDPRIILGNLVAEDHYWEASATLVPGSRYGAPCLDLKRLLGLSRVLSRASVVAAAPNSDGRRPPAVLLLPELALPRQWFRMVANHVVRSGRFGLVTGVEYLHDTTNPFVRNQAFAVLPGPFSSVATWPWTKRLPARMEGSLIAGLPTPVSFPPSPASQPPRTTVNSPWGRFSVLICSEMIETRRVADLLGRADLVLCPAWNPDTSSYDHLIQSVGFQLHAIIAIANNGHYSDCRAWAPLKIRWKRDLCRLIERDVNDVVYVDVPLRSLEEFHAAGGGGTKPEWRPLPPDWP